MQPGGNVQYMLDGGALLHRVPSQEVLQLTRKCATYIELTYKGNTEDRRLCLTGTTICQLKL